MTTEKTDPYSRPLRVADQIVNTNRAIMNSQTTPKVAGFQVGQLDVPAHQVAQMPSDASGVGAPDGVRPAAPARR